MCVHGDGYTFLEDSPLDKLCMYLEVAWAELWEARPRELHDTAGKAGMGPDEYLQCIRADLWGGVRDIRLMAEAARCSVQVEGMHGEIVLDYRAKGSSRRPALLRWHGQHYSVVASYRRRGRPESPQEAQEDGSISAKKQTHTYSRNARLRRRTTNMAPDITEESVNATRPEEAFKTTKGPGVPC